MRSETKGTKSCPWRRDFYRGIFFRTFIMITSLCAILIVLPTTIAIPVAKGIWLNGLESQARSLSASIAEVSGNAFVTGDYSFIIDHNTQVMKGSSNIRYVIIMKQGGPALVHTGAKWEIREKPDPTWHFVEKTGPRGRIQYSTIVKGEVFHHMFPLQFSGINWGTLYVGLSLDDYHKQIGTVVPLAIGSALLFLTIAVFMASFIAGRITSPILVLRDTADRIIRGELTARADVRSGDEVQDLAGSFNRMTDAMVKSQHDTASARDYIENILRSLAECLIVFKADRTIELVNDAATALLGYTGEELIGKPVEIIFNEYDGFLDESEEGHGIDRTVTSNLEKQFLTKDGKRIPVLFSYAPLCVRDGEPPGMVGIALDITDRKRAMQALRERENYLRTILESVQTGVLVIDAETHTIVDANSVATKLLDLPRENLIDHECHRYVCPAEKGACPITDLGKQIDNAERSLIHGSGKKMPIIKSVVPVTINGRRCLLESFVDISVQKQNEEELKEAKESAIAANRSKSEFLANMSHEIRTPMNGVLGMLDLIIHTQLNKEQKKYADTAYKSANTLLHILNDILDLSKIESGKMELESVDFDVNEALDEVITLFSARAKTKLLRLYSVVDDSMIRAVRGDPFRFRQVLANLVGNAIKFTGAGEVVIRAVVIGYEDEDVLFRFEVADTGIGIGDDEKEKIFKPFAQADSSTTRSYGGTGLGLSISRELVAMMGGTIGVDSNPGKGSTFWFTVRFQRSRGELIRKDTAGSSALRADSRSANARKSAKDFRILLAEDNRMNQELIQAILAPFSFRMDIASDGGEAFEALTNHPYDLVLMDCQMPRLDGYQVTRLFREQERSSKMPRTPIIALTANAMRGDREKCLEAGMDDYLPKPFYREDLLSLLDRWVDIGVIEDTKESSPQGVTDTPGAASSNDVLPARTESEESTGNRQVIDVSALDRIRALQREGRPDILGKLVTAYLVEAQGAMKALELATAEKSTQDMFRLAHKLKSSSANVGALHLSALLKDLELLGRQDEVEGTADLFGSVAKEFEAVQEALKTLAPGRSGEQGEDHG